MNRGSRIVALAAAYAVALNALLPALAGLVLPDPARGLRGLELALFCSAGGVLGSEGSHVPAKPQPPSPGAGACAMPACVPGARSAPRLSA
jgi:hypothetical protein